MKKYLFLTIFVFIAITLNAQNHLIIDSDIRLPKDSLEGAQLISNLNDLLLDCKDDNENSLWILPSEKSETKILLGEIRDIYKRDSTQSVKPYLLGLESLSDGKSYLVQISYINLYHDQLSLEGIINFIAHNDGRKFLFSSPLRRNTKDWSTIEKGNLVFHYQNPDAENIINEKIGYTIEFNKQLGITQTREEFYFSDTRESLSQILQLLGIQYSKNYNGLTWNSIFFSLDEINISVWTQRLSRKQSFDPHYLYHRIAGIAIPDEKENYNMICAGASYYSSCWGMNWEEIKLLFKEKMSDKNNDWLELYFKRHNFGKSRKEYILVTSLINGLIIEKVEKEQGFSAVKELYASGNMYKNKEQFFNELERISGINEKNFNKKIGRIISKAMSEIETTNR